jgi:hypothetical protein
MPGPVLRILQSRPKGWMRMKNAEYIKRGIRTAAPLVNWLLASVGDSFLH